MAKLVVVAVRDKALEAFMRPFFVPARGMAARSFQDEVNRAADDNSMYKHPQDYDLYYLGSFDEESGVFTNNERPELIVRGTDSKAKE